MTWNTLLDKLYRTDSDALDAMKPNWLGWDGWVSITGLDKEISEKQSGNNDVTVS